MVLRGFMTRLIVLLPILAACSVGTYGESMQGTDSGGGDDRDLCVTKVAAPTAAHNHTAVGANLAGPRAGVGCMAVGGCHGAQPGSTTFSIAGTAYKETTNPVTPAAGATVRLFMPGTKKSIATTVTDAAGNFSLSTPVTFPATGLEVDITACRSTPDIHPLIAPIRANEGNCASSDSCHVVPGPRPVFLTGG
jgi:hypothetical protein